MARKQKPPVTPALRVLRAAKIDFTLCPYAYVQRGGARASAAALGVPLSSVVKTLVMENTATKKPLLVLMHGDRGVSTRQLARALGVKSIEPCTPEQATRHTGYLVGGTSPFGTRKSLPVYVERTILGLDQIWINAGKRGLLVRITPADLAAILSPVPVSAARDNL
ncbi:MAG: YbaK/EbsC family protein [Myxococcota bacterium]|nr:YbaK/EbsC family protein [Myxococcota bacterium]